MAILSQIYAVVLVALGLGFVIFIHELGHFLLAKWNDVKVEKFSIGFGPTLFGFRRGETEYVLAAIPLGGFVKMLGEGPEDEKNKTTDPRAFPNKSVGARMMIISAGVVMNIILGLACFVYAYGHGMDAIPARVGSVVAGSPAYLAGMRSGDEIVSIDGRSDIKFQTLQLKVSLSRDGQALKFGVNRSGRDEPIVMDIRPIRESGSERPTIGILPALSMEIHGLTRPAGMASAPDYPGLKDDRVPEEYQDVLTAAGPDGAAMVPMATIEDYNQLLADHADQPIKHVIERRLASDGEDSSVKEKFEVVFPPAYFIHLGLRMTIEPISAIRDDSPAEAAGFRVGDRIVKVDGQDDFDPMRLPSLCHEHAGQELTFEVERKAAGGSPKIETLSVTPDASTPWDWAASQLGDEVDIPGLGLCYPVSPKVVAVTPDSPAARAGIKVGDVISAMIFKAAKTTDAKGSDVEREVTLSFDDGSSKWVQAFSLLQLKPYEVKLVVNKASKPTPVEPTVDKTWPYPDRGLIFLALRTKMPPQPIGSALRLGYEDTVENILSFYAMLRSLTTGRLGMGNLGGVITISRFAFGQAQAGLTYLIFFLGMLSINLAVINFLPIPPLDGGQMVFLAAEKVRGRPLPESALVAGTYLGLFLVLSLMVFVTFQDIVRWLF